MGSTRFDASDFQSYAKATKAKIDTGGIQATFTSTRIQTDLNPLNIPFRESRDSDVNPKSTPVIIMSDVTGSMGFLAAEIITKSMGLIMQEVYDRKPVTDPHLLIGAIGDAYRDTAPLQVTQFEAGMVLAEQMEKIYIEGGGGGNNGESYSLAWYFAAHKTRCDAIEKRHRKGYLFTIGDEPIHDRITRSQVKSVFGDDVEQDVLTKELLELTERDWEVFHLWVSSAGSYGRYDQSSWKVLLGERHIEVSDHTKLGEVIVSTMQVIEGADVNQVVGSWSGDTSLVVHQAIKDLTVGGQKTSGMVRY